MGEGLSDKDRIDLFMQEYSLLRNEVLVHLNNYKAHVKYFQLVVGTIVAAAGILKVDAGILKVDNESLAFVLHDRIILAIGTIFFTTVISFVAMDVVHLCFRLL